MKQLERALLERDSQITQLRLENEQLQEKLQNILGGDHKRYLETFTTEGIKE